MIDGYIARHYNQSSVLGSILDPLADKLLMTVMTLTLASKALIPIWLAAIILGRDVGLSLSALWWRWKTLSPPKTMKRYWDPSLPSAQVKPTQLSKVNTALQIALLGACTASPLIPETWGGVLMGIEGMKYLVAATTIGSGMQYLGGAGAVSLHKKGKDAVKTGGKNIT
jgi:cardiolipin synthase (CMP-forming)